MPKHLNDTDDFEMVEIGRLKPAPFNPNQGDLGAVIESIKANGFFGALVVQRRTCHVLGGNHRLQAAKTLGYDRLPVTWVDVSDTQAKKILLADNRTARLGNDDPNALAELLAELAGSEDGLAGTGFDGDDLDQLINDLTREPDAAGSDGETAAGEVARKTLAERFGVPPFSVLDARQGYWQDRKRAWVALGIQSELGRGESCLGESQTAETFGRGNGPHAIPGGGTGKNSGYMFKTSEGDSPLKEIQQGKERRGALEVSDTIHRMKPAVDQGRKRGLARSYGQDLMRGEHEVGERRLTWVAGDRPESELDEVSGKNLAAQPQSGTSIFDPVLCELAYRWFCPEGGAVLDPFAGGSVRGVVASHLGRSYTGIELRPEQVAANEEQARDICKDVPPRWIVGDSRAVATLTDSAPTDFVFSCPPYADLEVYSDDPADLSTLPYERFLEAYRAIIYGAVAQLRSDRFACFVVGDVRDKKGFYRNFVGDTVNAFQDAGATLYNEAILVTAAGSLPIRVGKQFGSYRKLGKTHQNVLVFYKGDIKKIPDVFGDVEFGLDLDAPED